MQTSDELGQLAKSFDEKASLLEEENSECIEAGQELPLCRGEMKIIAKESTAELARANEILKMEITKRKCAEEALRESELILGTILSLSPFGISIRNTNGNYLHVNDEYCRIFDFEKEELIGRNFSVILPLDEVGTAKETYTRLLNKNLTRPRECKRRRKDGAAVYIQAADTMLHQENGQNALITVVRDITEHKQTEESLLLTEDRYRRLFEDAVLGIFRSTPEGKLIHVNPAYARMFGFNSPEEAKRQVNDVVVDLYADPSRRNEILRIILDADGPVHAENRYRRKDGNIFTGNLDVWAVRDREGKLLYLEGFVEDITEQKRAEESLRESQQRFRELAELLPETIFEMDISGDLTFANLNAFDHFGYSQEDLERGMNGFEMISPEDRPRAMENAKKIISGKKTGGNEYKALRKDGSTFPAIIRSAAKVRDGKPVGIRGIVIDITETKTLEAQLFQAQKLESIGTLAGGIAHDFNNILVPIIGYTELALSDMPQSTQMRYGLEQILNAATRARDLVKQILAFGRAGKEQQQMPVEIGSIVKEALKLLSASLPSSIEIRQDIAKGVALADPTRIHQILLNLCTNAAHAMGDKGVLEVRLSRVDLNKSDLDGQLIVDLKPGQYLKLSISDTGCGMDARTLERIFDPYFTTKEVGKGSGLGLAVVHGIVKRQGGAITVQSEPGKGTLFCIYIPAMEAMVDPIVETRQVLPTGTERILLIDDEQSIVEMETAVFEELGYDVTPETDSLRALEIFRSRPGEFDLIITDYTMPNLTGIDLSKEIRRIEPDIPIILCTGFSEKVTEKGAMDLGVELAMKPFSMKQIAELVRKVLPARDA
ncbi:MAG: PAS domain S-box protein [Syntrophobacteraceae bacterium]